MVAYIRQASAVFIFGLLTACSSLISPETENVVARSFYGGVAGDEPQAVIAARDILRAGGNAVDAATAMYFALSVTLPSSASLGSGGVCLVRDIQSNQTKALDFVAGTPKNISKNAQRPSAVPAAPLGFFLMHSKFGRLPWPQLVSVGERLARFGSNVSRALLNDLKPVASALMEDAEARQIYVSADGALVTEGQQILQPDLAEVLANIRVYGPSDFYKGKLARRLVSAVNAAGGSLTLDDLASYNPRWLDPFSFDIGRRTAYFFPPPGVAGVVAAQMMGMLISNGGFAKKSEADNYHLLSEVALRAFAERRRWLGKDFASTEPMGSLVADARMKNLMKSYNPARHSSPNIFNPPPEPVPENPSATGFVVIDAGGSAVACTLTMNNLFGTGKIAPGTGIILSAVANNFGRGPQSMGPMMVVHKFTRQFHFAGTASGGVAAPTALVNVAARTNLSNESLKSAINKRRVHHSGAPDITYYEPGMPPEIVKDLARRGHLVAPTPKLGFVNAAFCSIGLPRDPDGCEIVSDWRGNGVAIEANEP
ncbi:MAG: gamma-glutamyltransferase [Rhodospirillales bacterium]|nr:gamma-glutamyltransferase [Rhodospirillales bacterium]